MTATVGREAATAPVPAAAVPGTRAPGAPGAASGGWSAEIQALRALAVGLVVVYHLWPGRLPGGYVGVDVFFVISGFLISGHIVRDLRRGPSGRGTFSLTRFYVRRARRLLPASLFVLLCVAVATVVLLPSTRWVATGQQILASAAYVQNWVLAGADVDYLSPTVTPTAVQHFWSLSVEEQFYLVWPVLLLVTALLGRRRRAALAAVMAAVAAVSFAHGVLATEADPAGAYFWSTTRVWEFAFGGLLAVLLTAVPGRSVTALGRTLRGALGWAGFAAIAASALLYTDRTPFPGTAALLPVAGTLLVIAAGTFEGSWSPASLVSFGPVQFLGDVSYSLYLWHWPLIILTPAALGVDHLGLEESLTVLALSVLFAALTMVLVERPLRSRPPKPDRARPPRWQRLAPVSVILALTLAAGAVAGWSWYRVDADVEDATRAAAGAIEAGTPCFGADALRPGCEPPLGDMVTPHPSAALAEWRASRVWRQCVSRESTTAMRTCEFGDPDGRTHVVLFGDSHAQQWAGAVDAAAKERGWRVTTYLRAACTPNEATMRLPDRGEQERCHDWATRAIDRIAADDGVDLVVTTALDKRAYLAAGSRDGYETGVRGYQETWARFVTGGRRVLVIGDTPLPRDGLLDCVAGSDGGAGCRTTVARATRVAKPFAGRTDPMTEAARRSDPARVSTLDLLPAFCAADCPAVIGNVLVHADDNHVSPTYARTLAPRLGEAVAAALPADRRAG